ncbi:C-type lectin domain family 4 member E-like [Mytilus trossulus]|uniref:C-type lectin domain family 4 member E-like n=1 Tax=Mytilus trossulus TaxID=6551 RepID=UPI0030071CBA
MSFKKTINMFNVISGIILFTGANGALGGWTFKKLPQSIPSTWPEQHVYLHASFSLEECVVICTLYPTCKSVYLHANTCVGLLSVTPDNYHHSIVDTYYKHSEACEETGFILYNGICLMISEIKLSWYDAERYCEDKGGHLIVLDTETKHNSSLNFIYNFYNGSEYQFFVGASDLEIEGVWKWITPSSMNYFNFKTPFQPDNDDDKFTSLPANCAVLSSQGTFRRKRTSS